MYTYEIFVQNDGAQLLEDIIEQKTEAPKILTH